MKKFFTLLALAACCAAAVWSCSDDYDDSELRQQIADIKTEIASMKEQVNSLRTLVEALAQNKFITNCTDSGDSWTITFNDGQTITIRNGKDGADGADGADGKDAPVLGISLFEGVYYWTLGGAGQWLTDEAGNKIPVAGQDGKTPSIDDNGYWTIDGKPILDADGQPVKAVGEKGEKGDTGAAGADGDSFFRNVEQTEEAVIFTLSDGQTIVIPLARQVNFVIDRLALTLKYGQTARLNVTQKGIEQHSISKPDGWRAALEGDELIVTAPVKENLYAERQGTISVVAVGATATVIAKLEVTAGDAIFDDNSAGSSDWEEWN